jgi:hypothetical protein
MALPCLSRPPLTSCGQAIYCLVSALLPSVSRFAKCSQLRILPFTYFFSPNIIPDSPFYQPCAHFTPWDWASRPLSCCFRWHPLLRLIITRRLQTGWWSCPIANDQRGMAALGNSQNCTAFANSTCLNAHTFCREPAWFCWCIGLAEVPLSRWKRRPRMGTLVWVPSRDI